MTHMTPQQPKQRDQRRRQSTAGRNAGQRGFNLKLNLSHIPHDAQVIKKKPRPKKALSGISIQQAAVRGMPGNTGLGSKHIQPANVKPTLQDPRDEKTLQGAMNGTSILCINTVSIPGSQAHRHRNSAQPVIKHPRRKGSGRATQLRSFAISAMLPMPAVEPLPVEQDQAELNFDTSDVLDTKENNAEAINGTALDSQQVESMLSAQKPASMGLHDSHITSSPIVSTAATPARQFACVSSPATTSRTSWLLRATPLEGIPEQRLFPLPTCRRMLLHGTASKNSTPGSVLQPQTSSKPLTRGTPTTVKASPASWILNATPLEGIPERGLLQPQTSSKPLTRGNTPSTVKASPVNWVLNATPLEGIPERGLLPLPTCRRLLQGSQGSISAHSTPMSVAFAARSGKSKHATPVRNVEGSTPVILVPVSEAKTVSKPGRAAAYQWFTPVQGTVPPSTQKAATQRLPTRAMIPRSIPGTPLDGFTQEEEVLEPIQIDEQQAEKSVDRIPGSIRTFKQVKSAATSPFQFGDPMHTSYGASTGNGVVQADTMPSQQPNKQQTPTVVPAQPSADLPSDAQQQQHQPGIQHHDVTPPTTGMVDNDQRSADPQSCEQTPVRLLTMDDALTTASKSTRGTGSHNKGLQQEQEGHMSDGLPEVNDNTPAGDVQDHAQHEARHVASDDERPVYTTRKNGNSGSGQYGDDENEELASGGRLTVDGMPAGDVLDDNDEEEPNQAQAQQTSPQRGRNKRGRKSSAAQQRAAKRAAPHRRQADSDDDGDEQQDDDNEDEHQGGGSSNGSRSSNTSRRKSLAGAGLATNTEGLRRTTRVRVQPLEYWRGEKKEYDRKHRTMPTVAGVLLRTPNAQWPLNSTGHQAKKTKARTQK